MTEYTTNAHGIRFYIERAKDFDDDGRMIDGLVVGNEELSGVWFETRDHALAAVADYRVAA